MRRVTTPGIVGAVPDANTVKKLTLLGSLYLAQGLPDGFFRQTLPVMLRREGVSLEGIGLATLLMLPWGLKFLWAPLVDRYGLSLIHI